MYAITYNKYADYNEYATTSPDAWERAWTWIQHCFVTVIVLMFHYNIRDYRWAVGIAVVSNVFARSRVSRWAVGLYTIGMVGYAALAGTLPTFVQLLLDNLVVDTSEPALFQHLAAWMDGGTVGWLLFNLLMMIFFWYTNRRPSAPTPRLVPVVVPVRRHRLPTLSMLLVVAGIVLLSTLTACATATEPVAATPSSSSSMLPPASSGGGSTWAGSEPANASAPDGVSIDPNPAPRTTSQPSAPIMAIDGEQGEPIAIGPYSFLVHGHETVTWQLPDDIVATPTASTDERLMIDLSIKRNASSVGETTPRMWWGLYRNARALAWTQVARVVDNPQQSAPDLRGNAVGLLGDDATTAACTALLQGHVSVQPFRYYNLDLPLGAVRRGWVTFPNVDGNDDLVLVIALEDDTSGYDHDFDPDAAQNKIAIALRGDGTTQRLLPEGRAAQPTTTAGLHNMLVERVMLGPVTPYQTMTATPDTDDAAALPACLQQRTLSVELVNPSSEQVTMELTHAVVDHDARWTVPTNDTDEQQPRSQVVLAPNSRETFTFRIPALWGVRDGAASVMLTASATDTQPEMTMWLAPNQE